jgi:hypothetical protein
MPLVAVRSLIEIGTSWSGSNVVPFLPSARAAAPAAASADSRATVT